MHLHILGIAGTFMGGLAQLASAAGHKVTGADAQVYPPMSDQLESAGIEYETGFDPQQLQLEPDQVVVGNVMTRGKPVVEVMLDKGLSYTSGPQWLFENILRDRWVLAVSGTHGKTSTASMLAWILDYANLDPGFLIGGVPENFGVSARLGESPFFVVEADEYDTAFFDKRSKFVHYHPRTLIINNMEFDHADIFRDLDAIQTQFHHLVRMLPSQGLLICPDASEAVEETLERGLWTPVETVSVGSGGRGWVCQPLESDYSRFELFLNNELVGEVHWSLIGQHNAANAMAAIAAARHAGVPVSVAIEALATFKGIKRRLEVCGEVDGVTVYDDFAHHPTAIETTIQGLRARIGSNQRILAVMEPRSNTMKLGVQQAALSSSFAGADQVFIYEPPTLDWSVDRLEIPQPTEFSKDLDTLVENVVAQSRNGDHILVMSNGSFGGIHGRLLDALSVSDLNE